MIELGLDVFTFVLKARTSIVFFGRRQASLEQVSRKEPKQVSFRVSEQTFTVLAEVAKEAGMSVPTFVKAKALGVRIKTPKVSREGALEIARELRRIGGNVNQIAKHLNQGRGVLDGQLEGIQRELQSIWQRLS